MRKICVLNYKGGTGKTTVVVNLADALARSGKKVLIIDSDPQGSSGYYLGVQSPYTLYDLLVQDISHSECIINARKGVDIITGNERLFPAGLQLSQQQGREHVLSRKLQSLDTYDYVLVDCPPSLNLLNQNSLLFCDELFLPVSMEYLSLPGILQLLQNIRLIAKLFQKNIRISKVIPTFYSQRSKRSSTVHDSLTRTFPNLVSTPIRTCNALSESVGYQQTIFEYAPKSNGAQDFKKLLREVLTHG